ncbi:MAG: hypothetical protein II859_13805 [Bacteroidales bacterium]|nr:hypothetical protein [Bacteroidales bacterium]
MIAILLLCAVSLFAQAPEKFTYQAVVRNANNSLVTNVQVGVRVSILQGSASGTADYVEVHTATTNANGLVTVIIGDGTVQQGTFADIDWANGPSIPAVPTNVSAFTNDAGYLTSYTETDPLFTAWDKNYNDLTNKPTIPTVPTVVSAFNNDAGYITATQVPAQVNADWNATSGATQVLNKPTLFSGNYNDLTDKPENISVPDSVSAFVNDAGYITQDQLNTLLGGFNSLIDSLSNEIYTLRMMMDTTLYTVTVMANNDSIGSVFGSGSFRWGATDTLIAVPDPGYQLKYWVSNLGDTLTNSTIVITVKQNVVWIAYFDLQELPQWMNYSNDTWHDMYTTISELKSSAVLNTSKVTNKTGVWNDLSYTDYIMDSNIDYYFPFIESPVALTDANIIIKIPEGKSLKVFTYTTISGWVEDNSLFTNTGNNIYSWASSINGKAIYGIICIFFIFATCFFCARMMVVAEHVFSK